MQNCWNGTNSSNFNQQNRFPQQTSYPFTNVAYVTSLEEALIRTTQFNSDMIYFNQDRNEFYRVRVDTEGRKGYLTFVYNLPEPPAQPASQPSNEYASLVARIEALEKRLEHPEVTDNA